MNQQSDLLKRENITPIGYDYMAEKHEEDQLDVSSVMNHGQMMQRKVMSTGETTDKQLNFNDNAEEQAAEKSFDQPVVQNTVQSVQKIDSQQAAQEKLQMLKSKVTSAQEQAKNTVSQPQTTQPVQQQKPIEQPKPAQTVQQQKPAGKPQNTQPAKPKVLDNIHLNISLDDLAAEYIKMMKQYFDIELSHNICFDNIRKFCDMNVKNYDKTLYFIENTYRVSTLIYLAINFPIIFICTVISEQNRKNVLKYISNEVEIAAKPFADIRKIRFDRYSQKFKSMDINDAATVTPGVTSLSPDIINLMMIEFKYTCDKLKRFNKELSDMIAKFNDDAKNDVVYIYSNWWYLLQLFENVPDAREYIMSITDDTRRNLKI